MLPKINPLTFRMATKQPSRRLARFFINIFAAALLITASVTLTLYLQDRFQLPKATANTTEPVIPEPMFVSLEPFTVSLRDDDGSKILYVGITLRVTDEMSRDMVSDYMPEVRDRVLRILTKQGTRQVQAPDGREIIASQLQEDLTKPFLPHPRGPDITRVLFTAYVVQ